jgi:hypothetical protein
MYQSHVFTVAAGAASFDIERHKLGGAGIADYYRNAQISVEGLGGGTFTVNYRVPEGQTWREHVAGATESDTVMIAGSRGPLVEALQITFSGVPAPNTPRIVLNLWSRGVV